jgi:hypothetical protein
MLKAYLCSALMLFGLVSFLLQRFPWVENLGSMIPCCIFQNSLHQKGFKRFLGGSYFLENFPLTSFFLIFWSWLVTSFMFILSHVAGFL